MAAVPQWFTSEVAMRLRNVKRVPGSPQHYACCPALAHDDQHASLGIRPGDDVMIVFNCQAGCSAEEIRAGFVALGIPEEYLGPLGTPAYEARRQARGTSDERRQVERMRWQMLDFKATVRGLLSADLTLAMLKVRLLAVVDETDIPTGRKEYVAFALRAGVSQPRAYAAWKSDPLTQGQDQCVTEDYVVLAQPENGSQAPQVTEDDGIIEARTFLSEREEASSRNENYRNEKNEDEAMEALRNAGLTKPAA